MHILQSYYIYFIRSISSKIINDSTFNLFHKSFPSFYFILWDLLLCLFLCFWANTVVYTLLLQYNIHSFLRRFSLLQHLFSFLLFFLSDFFSLLQQSFLAIFLIFNFQFLFFRLLFRLLFFNRFFLKLLFFFLNQLLFLGSPKRWQIIQM